jgi:hypothetical protein
MEPIRINTYVTAETAITLGCTRYGAYSGEVREAELADLDDEERALLINYVGPTDGKGKNSLFLTLADLKTASFNKTHPVTWGAIRMALAREIGEARSRKAKEDAESTGRIEAAGACPIEDWVDGGRTGSGLTWCDPPSRRPHPRGAYLYDGESKDPRLTATWAMVDALVALRVADWRAQMIEKYLADSSPPEPGALRDPGLHKDPQLLAHHAACAKALEEKVAAAVAAKEAVKQRVVEFAKTVPSLARAATDEYDVATAAVDSILDEVMTRAKEEGGHAPYDIGRGNPTRFVAVEGTSLYDRIDWVERKAPDAQAFALRDAIIRILKDVHMPSCVTLHVSRIARITIRSNDGDGDDETFTGIVVWASVAEGILPDRHIFFSAEG